MNFLLLDKIGVIDRGILATIVDSEGHTYKKKGEKALFAVDDPYPVCGNLGSLCVDQHIMLQGREAFAEGKPRLVTIDTSDKSDIHFGYGTFCGGKLQILLEPLTESYKIAYAKARGYLEANQPFYVGHDVKISRLSVTPSPPQRRAGLFVESIPASTKLFIFGATPLAQDIITTLRDTAFKVHIVDWRPDYLARFDSVATLLVDKKPYPFDDNSFVLLISHGFEKDKEALGSALSAGCAYVGLLSSTSRRDMMYEDLEREGVSKKDLAKVSSPIGIDIGGRLDTEIAISVAAELVRSKNR
ncbi:MAG: XdhC family protein [Candidatus Krumholzibacteria bacterium]|nr:XdhC family protein [Candidatus Krumholzibacteria bacterium]